MPDRVRWGIISTANIARTAVIPAIKESRNGIVIAVASRDAARARAYADELDIERAYGSYEELLADPDIDAIYNPLPNDGHAPWSIASAKAHKPTLVEKPMARTVAEAKTIVDAFRAEKVLLAEAFMYRYHPQHAKIRALLDEGVVGSLNLIEAVFTYSLPMSDAQNVRLQAAIGGGGLLDVGCYCVNLCRMVTGKEPESVTAQAVYGKVSGVDENFVATLRFPGDVLAYVACGMRSLVRNEYTLSGPDGSITAGLAFRPPEDGPTEIHVRRGDNPIETIVIPAANQYTLMVEDFADAVQNKRITTYDPMDSLSNMRVLDALDRAAREGIMVRL
ncbi:MAG: Gfo/Idh/MocA family oxidoreductase [Chloroflexota bacterium]